MEDCALPEDYEHMEEWKPKWGWWNDRNHETWYRFDNMQTDWIEVEDYPIWVDFHMSARLVLFYDKKIEKEMKEYEEWRDLMGEHMGRNY